MKFEYHVVGQSLTLEWIPLLTWELYTDVQCAPKNNILNMVSKDECMSGLVKRTLGFNAPVAIKLQCTSRAFHKAGPDI